MQWVWVWFLVGEQGFHVLKGADNECLKISKTCQKCYLKKVAGHPTSGQAAVTFTALTRTAISREGLALSVKVSVGEPLCPTWM